MPEEAGENQSSNKELTPITHNELEEVKTEILGEVRAEFAEIHEIKQILVKKEEAFRGPLPHPDHFAKYNKILPGSGNRLLKLVEDNLKHNFFMEKLYGFFDGLASLGGLLMGGVIAIGTIVGSGYLVLQGHDAAGSILGTGTLTALVSVFIYGTRHKNNKQE